VIPPTELAQEMDRHLHARLIKHRALTAHKDELNQASGHRR